MHGIVNVNMYNDVAYISSCLVSHDGHVTQYWSISFGEFLDTRMDELTQLDPMLTPYLMKISKARFSMSILRSLEISSSSSDCSLMKAWQRHTVAVSNRVGVSMGSYLGAHVEGLAGGTSKCQERIELHRGQEVIKLAQIHRLYTATQQRSLF